MAAELSEALSYAAAVKRALPVDAEAERIVDGLIARHPMTGRPIPRRIVDHDPGDEDRS